MSRKLLVLFLTVLLSAIGSPPAFAAEITGQIRGTVTDSEGLSVPGSAVSLSSAKMQGTKSAESDGNGRYRFVTLPPGEYQIEFKKAGFHPANASVRVSAGLSSSVDVVLNTAAAGEEMVVSDVRPTVDTTSVKSGIVLTKDMLRDIPNAGRSYQGATTLSPGVTSNGTGNPNVRGSLSYGNQYYIDGVNTTDPLTGTFSLNINMDAIEEIQVLTGGMDAEYGRSMGGAVNVVTRSGGNEFEGDVQLLYNSTATQLYTPLPQEESSSLENEERSAAINFGGPLLKDKLWFFTSVQGNYSVSSESLDESIGRPDAYPMQPMIWKSGYWFGKLTWKPNKDHRLWVQAQGDPTDIENSTQSAYVLPNAENWWQQGGWLASLGHQWTPDGATIVESQLFSEKTYITVRPMQDKLYCEKTGDYGECTEYGDIDPDDPLYWDQSLGNWYAADPDGFSYGPDQYSYFTDRRRHSVNTSVTRFWSLLGEHQSKLGFQAELLTSHTVYPGLEEGLESWTHNGDPTDFEGYVPDSKTVYETNWDAKVTGTLISWYLQDVWQPHHRLTIRPGVRFDHSDFKDNSDTTVFQSLTIAPRVGAAYDLTNDGRTRLHAYYGRFYDSGFLAISDILTKDLGGSTPYTWDAEHSEWIAGGAQAASAFLVHDDLVNPWSDEIDFGLARDFGGGWGLSSTFTYEHAQNLWEDDGVNLIWNEDGTQVLGSRDGTGLDRYRLRTPDDAFIDYTSVEITANRVFDEHWGMLASYTWSHAYGRDRNESYGLASWGYDIPTQQDDEVGLMSYDVPDQVKIAGSYRDPYALEITDRTQLGFLFGWSFEMSSGFPYQPTYYNDYYYAWINLDGGMDGSYRLPAYSRTDLKTGVTLAQGETTWDLTVECFNAFNRRTVTSVDTTMDDENGEVYTNEDGVAVFGQPLSYQSPRYFQLGLRGEF